MPYLRVALHGGPHAAPGVSGVSLRRWEHRAAPSLALGPSPRSRVGSSPRTTIPAWVQPPCVLLQLGSMGCPVGCRGTTGASRLGEGWSVAPPGQRRSARHRGGRHGPCPDIPGSRTCVSVTVGSLSRRAWLPSPVAPQAPPFQANGSHLQRVVRCCCALSLAGFRHHCSCRSLLRCNAPELASHPPSPD